MDPPEEWKHVRNYEGYYQVSNLGRAKGHRGQILVGSEAGDGYRKIALCKPGFPNEHRYIHHLVLETFVSPRPEGMEACHGNFNRADNRLSNLRWGTHSENQMDNVRAGRHPEQQKTHCPQNHPLVRPNLVMSELRNGTRKCRSCNIARARIQRGLGDDIQALSDEVYVKVMNGEFDG